MALSPLMHYFALFLLAPLLLSLFSSPFPSPSSSPSFVSAIVNYCANAPCLTTDPSNPYCINGPSSFQCGCPLNSQGNTYGSVCTLCGIYSSAYAANPLLRPLIDLPQNRGVYSAVHVCNDNAPSTPPLVPADILLSPVNPGIAYVSDISSNSIAQVDLYRNTYQTLSGCGALSRYSYDAPYPSLSCFASVGPLAFMTGHPSYPGLDLIFLTETFTGQIRAIQPATNVTQTIWRAPSGWNGRMMDGQQGDGVAGFSFYAGALAVHPSQDCLFIIDNAATAGAVIRRVDFSLFLLNPNRNTANLTTVFGNRLASRPASIDGIGLSAQFYYPTSIKFLPGSPSTLLVTEWHAVRKINLITYQVSTIHVATSPLTDLPLQLVSDITFDTTMSPPATYLLSDKGSNNIRTMEFNRREPGLGVNVPGSLLLGWGSNVSTGGYVDAQSTQARFKGPSALVYDSTYQRGIAVDQDNGLLRLIHPRTVINACGIKPNPCHWPQGTCVNNENVDVGYTCSCAEPYYGGSQCDVCYHVDSQGAAQPTACPPLANVSRIEFTSNLAALVVYLNTPYPSIPLSALTSQGRTQLPFLDPLRVLTADTVALLGGTDFQLEWLSNVGDQILISYGPKASLTASSLIQFAVETFAVQGEGPAGNPLVSAHIPYLYELPPVPISLTSSVISKAKPVGALNSISSFGRGLDLILDASGSSSFASRPPIFNFSVLAVTGSPSGTTTATIKGILDPVMASIQAVNPSNPVLTIPLSFWLSSSGTFIFNNMQGGVIYFQVVVTNFVGLSSAPVQFAVNISPSSLVPALLVSGPQIVLARAPVSLNSVITLNQQTAAILSALNLAVNSSGAFTFSWSCAQGIPLDADTRNTPSLYIAPYSFAAGQQYTFHLSMTPSSQLTTRGIVAVTATFTLVCTFSAIQPAIASGSFSLIQAGSPLRLDASVSIDPNQQLAVNQSASLRYLWSCIYVGGPGVNNLNYNYGLNYAINNRIRVAASAMQLSVDDFLLTVGINDCSTARGGGMLSTAQYNALRNQSVFNLPVPLATLYANTTDTYAFVVAVGSGVFSEALVPSKYVTTQVTLLQSSSPGGGGGGGGGPLAVIQVLISPFVSDTILRLTSSTTLLSDPSYTYSYNWSLGVVDSAGTGSFVEIPLLSNVSSPILASADTFTPNIAINVNNLPSQQVYYFSLTVKAQSVAGALVGQGVALYTLTVPSIPYSAVNPNFLITPASGVGRALIDSFTFTLIGFVDSTGDNLQYAFKYINEAAGDGVEVSLHPSLLSVPYFQSFLPEGVITVVGYAANVNDNTFARAARVTQTILVLPSYLSGAYGPNSARPYVPSSPSLPSNSSYNASDFNTNMLCSSLYLTQTTLQDVIALGNTNSLLQLLAGLAINIQPYYAAQDYQESTQTAALYSSSQLLSFPPNNCPTLSSANASLLADSLRFYYLSLIVSVATPLADIRQISTGNTNASFVMRNGSLVDTHILSSSVSVAQLASIVNLLSPNIALTPADRAIQHTLDFLVDSLFINLPDSSNTPAVIASPLPTVSQLISSILSNLITYNGNIKCEDFFSSDQFRAQLVASLTINTLGGESNQQTQSQYISALAQRIQTGLGGQTSVNVSSYYVSTAAIRQAAQDLLKANPTPQHSFIDINAVQLNSQVGKCLITDANTDPSDGNILVTDVLDYVIKDNQGNPITISDLDQPIEFTLKINDPNLTLADACGNSYLECRYFSVANNKWQTDGCSIVTQTSTSVTCRCNHLTEFAILYSEKLKAAAKCGALVTAAQTGLFSTFSAGYCMLFLFACMQVARVLLNQGKQTKVSLVFATHLFVAATCVVRFILLVMQSVPSSDPSSVYQAKIITVAMLTALPYAFEFICFSSLVFFWVGLVHFTMNRSNTPLGHVKYPLIVTNVVVCGVILILAILIGTVPGSSDQKTLVTAATGLLAGINLISAISFSAYATLLNKQLSKVKKGSGYTQTNTNSTSSPTSSSATNGTKTSSTKSLTAVQKMFVAGQVFSLCFILQSAMDFVTTFTLTQFDDLMLALASVHYVFDLVAISALLVLFMKGIRDAANGGPGSQTTKGSETSRAGEGGRKKLNDDEKPERSINRSRSRAPGEEEDGEKDRDTFPSVSPPSPRGQRSETDREKVRQSVYGSAGGSSPHAAGRGSLTANPVVFGAHRQVIDEGEGDRGDSEQRGRTANRSHNGHSATSTVYEEGNMEYDIHHKPSVEMGSVRNSLSANIYSSALPPLPGPPSSSRQSYSQVTLPPLPVGPRASSPSAAAASFPQGGSLLTSIHQPAPPAYSSIPSPSASRTSFNNPPAYSSSPSTHPAMPPLPSRPSTTYSQPPLPPSPHSATLNLNMIGGGGGGGGNTSRPPLPSKGRPQDRV